MMKFLVYILLFNLHHSLMAAEIRLEAGDGDNINLTNYSLEFIAKHSVKESKMVGNNFEVLIFSVRHAKEILRFTRNHVKSKIKVRVDDVLVSEVTILEEITNGRLLMQVSKERFEEIKAIVAKVSNKADAELDPKPDSTPWKKGLEKSSAPKA